MYMLRRSSRSKAVPDAYVFPGGTVDGGDRLPQARERLVGECRPAEPALTYTAIRETFEECGLLFADAPIPEQRFARCIRTRLLEGKRSFNETVIDLGVRLDARAVRYHSRAGSPRRRSSSVSMRAFSLRALRPTRSRRPTRSEDGHDGRWVKTGSLSR